MYLDLTIALIGVDGEDELPNAVFLFASVALACMARADTITLENGDRLTGTIVKSDAKELILKTDDARPITDNPGLITLQWSAVRQITSSAPLYVVTPQGTTVGGTVTTEGTDLVVTPSTGAPQRIPLANVTTLRSQSEETAYERSLHPGLFESWQTDAAVGFGLARGNSHTTNLAIGFNAVRATMHDKLTAYMNSIYASSGLVIAPGVGPASPQTIFAEAPCISMTYRLALLPMAARTSNITSCNF